MFVRFLRRYSVRSRIIGGFLILLIFMMLSIPLVIFDNVVLTNRVRELANVESKADRLLLLALNEVLASRVNLTRYADDLTSSPSEAINNVSQATKYLEEARSLIADPEQKTATANILAGLVSYKTIIDKVQVARDTNQQQEITNLMFNSLRIEFDIDQQIRNVLAKSEAHINQANQAALDDAEQRLYFLVAGYIFLIIIAVFVTFIVQQSITKPIADLREGAESFRLEHKETAIPDEGRDELSVLAQTFNQISAELVQNIIGLEQHVTERTTELEKRTQELEDISGRMKKRADQLQAVAQVSRAVTSIQDVDELLPYIAKITSEQLGFYHVGIFLLDKDKGYAVLSAANSEGGKRMLERGHKLQVGAEGIVGYVAAMGRPRIALDTGADAIFFNNPDLKNTHSEMALPLTAGADTIGVLDVQSEEPAAFVQEDVELLTILADQVSIAIQNALRFEETQEAIKESENTIRQYLRKEWKDTADEAENLGYRFSVTGIGPLNTVVVTPNVVQAAQSGQTSIAQEKTERRMAIPIKLRGQVIGVMHLQSPSQRAWEKDVIDISQAIADRVALAIENARLLETSQNQAARERTIGEITSKIGASVNLRNVLQTAVEELGRIMPGSDVVIQLEGKRKE
jgi:GAF domain-containing protein